MSDPTEDPARPDDAGAEQPTPQGGPSFGHADDGQDPPDRDKPVSSREELYAKYVRDDDDEPLEPETPQEDDEVEQQDDEDDPAPEDEPSEEPAADEEDEPSEEDEPPAPDDDLDDGKLLGRVPDDEWEKLAPVTRKRINALRATAKQAKRARGELEELKPVAEFGQSVIEEARRGRMSDQDLATWLDIGTRVNQGGKAAVDELLKLAEDLGWDGPQAAPTDTQGRSPDQLPPWLEEMVRVGDISEEGARDVLRRTGQEKPPPPSDERQPAQTIGDTRRPDPAEQQAIQTGQRAIAEVYQARTKGLSAADLRAIDAEVKDEIRKRANGADPSAWGPIADAAFDLVLSRRKAKTPRRVRDGAPPSRQPTGGAPDPSKLTGRKRIHAMIDQNRHR